LAPKHAFLMFEVAAELCIAPGDDRAPHACLKIRFACRTAQPKPPDQTAARQVGYIYAKPSWIYICGAPSWIYIYFMPQHVHEPPSSFHKNSAGAKRERETQLPKNRSTPECRRIPQHAARTASPATQGRGTARHPTNARREVAPMRSSV
jgi:hypothetical protein